MLNVPCMNPERSADVSIAHSLGWTAFKNQKDRRFQVGHCALCKCVCLIHDIALIWK